MAVAQPEIERRVERFMETCEQAGLRVTHQRTEVFREVAASEEHPDAETIYQRVRERVTGISRDTVYRTLATLEGHGLIRRTGAMGGPARYDPNLQRHHHFVCTECGLIRDFSSESLDELPIPASVEGFGQIESVQVRVRGICAACIQRKDKR